MATQTSTTGQLANAAKEMIAKARFTEEHSAPALALIQKFTLEQGHDTLVVPKVGQMTWLGANEGEETTNEQDIGMTTTSVTTSIVGAKVIITDALLEQNSQDIWALVGKQMGDGRVRKIEADILALFTALNGGTTYGAAGAAYSAANALSGIAKAKTSDQKARLANGLRAAQEAGLFQISDLPR